MRTRLALAAASSVATLLAAVAVPAHAAPPRGRRRRRGHPGGQRQRRGAKRHRGDRSGRRGRRGRRAAVGGSPRGGRLGCCTASSGASADTRASTSCGSSRRTPPTAPSSSACCRTTAIAPKLNALQAAQQPGLGRGHRPDRARPRPVPGHRHRAGAARPRAASRTAGAALIEDAPWLAARDRGAAGATTRRRSGSTATSTATSGRAPTASLRLIEELATATDAATDAAAQAHPALLHRHQQPGRPGRRHRGPTATASTSTATTPPSSQPESRAMRDVVIAHPAAGDARRARLHRHHADRAGHRAARPELRLRPVHQARLPERDRHGGRRSASSATRRRPRPIIPFRDFAPGDWDDWPPIFTPMYAMYHGAIGHTVEVPLQVNGAAYDTLPVEELRRRSAINVDVVEATIRGRDRLHRRQPRRADRRPDRAVPARLGRRGAARDPGRLRARASARRTATAPTFPRAYVIPAGAGQRSAAAAARLVDHLVAHDVRVTPGRRCRSRLAGQALPGRLVRGRHAPAQARPGQRDAGGRAGHLQPGAADVRHLRLEPPACCGARRSTSSADRTRRRCRHPVPVSAARPTGAVPHRPARDLLLTLTDGARRRGRSTRCSTRACRCGGGTAARSSCRRQRRRGRGRGGRPVRRAVHRRRRRAPTGTPLRRAGDRGRGRGRRVVRAARDGLRGAAGVDGRAQRRLRPVRRGRCCSSRPGCPTPG